MRTFCAVSLTPPNHDLSPAIKRALHAPHAPHALLFVSFSLPGPPVARDPPRCDSTDARRLPSRPDRLGTLLGRGAVRPTLTFIERAGCASLARIDPPALRRCPGARRSPGSLRRTRLFRHLLTSRRLTASLIDSSMTKSYDRLSPRTLDVTGASAVCSFERRSLSAIATCKAIGCDCVAACWKEQRAGELAVR